MSHVWRELLVAAACGFIGAESARLPQKDHLEAMTSKMIGNVPVLNYDKAYGGVGSLEHTSAKENWFVVTDASVSDETLVKLCNAAEAECLASGHPEEGGTSYFEIRGTEQDLETIISSHPDGILFVEPDGPVIVEPIESTSRSSNTPLWGLERIGVSQRASQGEGSHVYVLDTGVMKTHNDFGGRVVPTADFTTSRGLCGDDLSCANDRQGHGTHCSGTAAGNSYGVAPSAVLHSVKVLGDDGSGQWGWLISALDLLATSSIRPAVASMSLGGRGRQESVRVAVDAAVTAGVIVVVAGGNNRGEACRYTPAHVESAITVGSTTSTDSRSSFSNYGFCIDIWAPGSDIRSASIRGDSSSITLSGTSMACPHVAGGAALILERNPTYNSGEVFAALHEATVKDVITDLRQGDTNSLLFVGAAESTGEWGAYVLEVNLSTGWGEYRHAPELGSIPPEEVVRSRETVDLKMADSTSLLSVGGPEANGEWGAFAVGADLTTNGWASYTHIPELGSVPPEDVVS